MPQLLTGGATRGRVGWGSLAFPVSHGSDFRLRASVSVMLVVAGRISAVSSVFSSETEEQLQAPLKITFVDGDNGSACS